MPFEIEFLIEDRVHLLDLDFGKSPPPGHEWVEAYKVWRKGFA